MADVIFTSLLCGGIAALCYGRYTLRRARTKGKAVRAMVFELWGVFGIIVPLLNLLGVLE